MMADAGVRASIAPGIEVQAGQGRPAAGRLLEHGIRATLSLDACSANGGHLSGTTRATIGTRRGFDDEAAREQGKASVEEMALTCRDVLELATIEGARVCAIDGEIGSLAPGRRAGPIAGGVDAFGMTPPNDPVGRFVDNAHSGPVDTILVDGEAAKRGARMPEVDEGVRRLAVESRDETLRGAGAAGARLGGDWIRNAREAGEA